MRKLMLILLVFVAMVGQAAAQHTGLFFDPADIPALRERYANDALFAGLRAHHAGIDRAAMRTFMKSEVRYNDHLYDIQKLSNFAVDMSFHYLFTGNRESGDLAREAIRTIMKFPMWDYFLDGDKVMGLQRAPAATIATALAIECLGDRLAKKERDAWLKMMAVKGNEPSFVSTHGMRYPESVTGWKLNPASTYFDHRPGDRGLDLSRWPYILDKINLKAIPASALAIGALTYRKYMGDDADTERWLEQAIFSLATFRDLFERDGSYQEGVSYAHYTASHLLQGFIPLKRLYGIDLSDILNWPGYIEYLHEMMMPTDHNPYEIVNFSDAGAGATSSVAFWIASNLYDGRAQWFGKTLGREHDAWSLLWYNPAIQAEAPPAGPRLYKAELDWVVARTGYSAADLVVALRSGGPMNHEHADRNSVIVKAFGEQLVTDPHRPPYSFTDPAWIMRLTGGHSAVLVDGKGHQYVDGREGTNASKAWAHVIRTGERDTYLFWTSDATPAYQLVQPDVRAITRTVVVLPEVQAVLLFDKVEKSDTASTVQARFFAYNNDGKGQVEAAGNQSTTTRPGAVLRTVYFSPQNVEASTATLPIPQEQAVMYPFVEASTQQPAKSTLLLSALLPAARDDAPATATISHEAQGGYYLIRVRRGDREMTCRVYDSGPVPEFAVGK